MSKMLSPEEELEKQYRDYKAQFEQWKEKNKNSVGTEAYTAYVKDFEAWERDVENRREMIRAKADAEAHKAQAAAQAKAQAAAAAEAKRKKEQELEEQQKKQQLEAEAAAQAAAYAQHQQSYLAHHQAAMQKEQQMRQANTVQEATAVHAADTSVPDETLDPTHMAEMMKQMAQVAHIMMSQGGEMESDAYQRPVSQPAQQPAGPPPQLWGSDRVPYDPSDPMYKKWGLRAAPPYHKPAYRPPPPDYQPAPCWLLVEQMKEEKLMLAPQVNMPPPPMLSNYRV